MAQTAEMPLEAMQQKNNYGDGRKQLASIAASRFDAAFRLLSESLHSQGHRTQDFLIDSRIDLVQYCLAFG